MAMGSMLSLGSSDDIVSRRWRLVGSRDIGNFEILRWASDGILKARFNGLRRGVIQCLKSSRAFQFSWNYGTV